MKPAILYISYDGMLEPLGQSQVLAYLEKLAEDYRIRLISFEKKEDWRNLAERERVQNRIEAAGIAWIPLRYHKSPTAPATAYDILAGVIAALYQTIRHRVAIVHARSYVPALMALAVKRLTGVKFLFDMRGFWADERIDGEIWPKGSGLYRLAKQLERHLLQNADHVVTLTNASAEMIRHFPYLKDGRPKITMIPTCADLDRFSPAKATSFRPFILGYVGSVGTWYLFDETLAFFKTLLAVEPDARLLIVNRKEHGFIQDRLSAAGVDPGKVEVVAVDHQDVPAMVRQMTAGTALIKPLYSKAGSAPTKLAEYLGCGIPCLGNVKVGDMEAILEGERVGVVLRDFSEEEMRSAVRRLLDLAQEPGIAKRCAEVARSLFSLEQGVQHYRDIYRDLLSTAGHTRALRMLVICPYPQGVAAAQRLKYEQYFDDWRSLGYDITTSCYMDMAMWRVAYDRGHHLSKLLGLARGHLRRLRDLFRLRHYDLVFIHMWVTPVGTSIFERLTRMLARKIIFDVEDNVILAERPGEKDNPNPLLQMLKRPGKARYLIRKADHVITSSPFLNETCLELNGQGACTYISSSVDTDRFLPASPYSNGHKVVIGWTGTFSSKSYLDLLRPVFQELAGRTDFRLKVIGNFDYALPGVDLEVVRWSREKEVEDLQSFDIGVYPLPMDDWVLGKSGLKAIQYMAFGLPTVATEVGTTPMLIRNGENGLLVKTQDEWLSALETLIRDPALRRRLGETARADAVRNYSTRSVAGQYRRVLESVMG